MVECEGFHKYSIEELREIINTATKELLKKEWEDIAKEVISRDSVKEIIKGGRMLVGFMIGLLIGSIFGFLVSAVIFYE